MKMENKKFDKKKAIISVVCIAVFAICGLFFLKKGNGKISTMDIQTTYVTLQYPKAYRKFLKHEEILDGTDATEVFSMVYQEKEIELFRLFLTSEESENAEGYLNTDNGVLCIALQPAQADPDVFIQNPDSEESEKDTEMESLYYAMLDGMGIVLDSIKQDSQYSSLKEIAENQKQDAKILYWDISLPTNITWEETSEEDIEQVTFFGKVGEKTLRLYTISLEEDQAESSIGQYVIDGQAKSINVTGYDLSENGALSEEEKAVAYTLMDTVNDVIQVIQKDKNYQRLQDIEE